MSVDFGFVNKPINVDNFLTNAIEFLAHIQLPESTSFITLLNNLLDSCQFSLFIHPFYNDSEFIGDIIIIEYQFDFSVVFINDNTRVPIDC